MWKWKSVQLGTPVDCVSEVMMKLELVLSNAIRVVGFAGPAHKKERVGSFASV